MEKNRIAQVGDILLERVGKLIHVGVIYKTVSKNHCKTAFIKWIKTPNCYCEKRGYLVGNIHNFKKRFRLIKT